MWHSVHMYLLWYLWYLWYLYLTLLKSAIYVDIYIVLIIATLFHKNQIFNQMY